MDKTKYCIYCGKVTLRIRPFILNPRADAELHCCSAKCLSEAKKFLEWDMKNRTRAYLLLTICVIANLLSFGFYWTGVEQFLPMLFMGGIVIIYPLVFMRYSSYQPLGIRKVTKIVRTFGFLFMTLSLFYMFFP
ncbi:MAG: hypothetical protein H6Q70_1487 [Firmicutes bacterium]|nr:hypothetical protein [Bacillota bacterium]